LNTYEKTKSTTVIKADAIAPPYAGALSTHGQAQLRSIATYAMKKITDTQSVTSALLRMKKSGSIMSF
jgi:hypothetical protein